jgi:predicted DNA-binding transcriptional regulator AlpA
MTTVKPPAPNVAELRPHDIIRLHEGPRVFGFGLTALAEKIAAGQVPAPLYLSDDGRARGWTGAQVHQWQRDTEAKQSERAAAAAARTITRAAQIAAGKAAARAARQASKPTAKPVRLPRRSAEA